MLVFWSFVSFVRNSVVLAVYLLFSVTCFFTVYEHLGKDSRFFNERNGGFDLSKAAVYE